MEKHLNMLEHAFLSVNRIEAMSILSELRNSKTATQIIEELIVPVMERIGTGWESGKVSLSQVYMSGRILEEFIDEIMPIEETDGTRSPKMAVAVLDDYHMLGKRIVYSTLRGGGHYLLDYGRMNAGDLAKRAVDDGLDVLLISALMLPSALQVKNVKNNISGSGIKIIAGGAPFRFDDELWKEVGADATCANASGVPSLIAELMGAQI